MREFKRIAIIRTDSIGDVMLTLPLAGIIKQYYPFAEITFVGKSYTRDIIQRCPHVDVFFNVDNWIENSEHEIIREIQNFNWDAVIFALPQADIMRWCKLAQVPVRIATAHRWSSWRFANYRCFFSRKRSDLHEAQLNTKLLAPLGIRRDWSLQELNEKLSFRTQVSSRHRRIIFHPFSQGSAVNWTLEQYDECIGLLSGWDGEIVVTGTSKDKESWLSAPLKNKGRVRLECGSMTLGELVDFIASSTALVACSTGPLHLAGAAGIVAVGLYVDERPIHPGRWRPLGDQIHLEVQPGPRTEVLQISPRQVATFLMSIPEHQATKR
jgi:ADP-heptose:LPS heptosyltransferase